VEANRAKITEHGLTNVLLQQDREVAEAYQVLGTPTAVLVQPDGTIGSSLALGADAIAALVAQLVSAPAPMPQDDDNGAQPVQSATLSVGAPAPLLMLPDLDGMPRSLTEFQRGSTLLLFWDPACGFCQRMLDELKAWEAHPPKGAPQLVLISSGSVEANRSMGLQSPILLDLGFSAGRQFGATGTPMAVLLDAQGRIASELAAGAAAVLKLAHGPHQMQPIGA
jgi:protein-disulfide isomerase